MVKARHLALFIGCLSLMACSTKAPVFSTLPPIAHPQSVDVVWNRSVTQSTTLDLTKYQPAYQNNRLYVSDIKGNVRAIRAETGQPIWQIRLSNGASAGPALGNGVLYVTTLNGQVVKIDQAQGKILWQVSLSTQANTPPTVTPQAILIKTVDDKLLTLDPATGKQGWRYDEGGNQLQLFGASRLLVVANTVVAGFSDGRIDGINLANGQLLWQQTLAIPQGFNEVAQMIGIYADPLASNQQVYVVGYHGNLTALDLSTGAIRWQVPCSSYDNMAMNQDSIFVADADGNIRAYNKQTGQLRWQQEALQGRALSGLALSSKGLVVGDETGTVHWLSSQDGHFIARLSLGKAKITIQPLVVGEKVYILSQQGILSQIR